MSHNLTQLRETTMGEQSTLIYLPGLHGDDTLLRGFRRELSGKAELICFGYPRESSMNWTFDDYARELDEFLGSQKSGHGWIIAESFGSQVAWAWLARRMGSSLRSGWVCDGVILVGGFVSHPWPRMAAYAERFLGRTSDRKARAFLGVYETFSRIRHRGDPRQAAGIAEFVRERMVPGDRDRLRHRIRLMLSADWRATARQTALPVWYVSGFWDLLVPWSPVRRWLKRECPGYKGFRMMWGSDHAVLYSQPVAVARWILERIRG
jgi:pimeloyl-ACP methyl ester carboxylesterase